MKTPIGVEKIYDALQDLAGKPDEETYEILLTGHANAGDESKIDETLSTLREFCGQVGTRAYSIIITASLKQNELSRAMKYTRQLQDSGGKATTSMLAEFFRTGAATGCVGEVIRTIKDMYPVLFIQGVGLVSQYPIILRQAGRPNCRGLVLGCIEALN